MPALSQQALICLDTLEDDFKSGSFSHSDFAFLSIKRNNLNSLFSFLVDINTDRHIETLKGLLLETEQFDRNAFKLKKNRKRNEH